MAIENNVTKQNKNRWQFAHMELMESMNKVGLEVQPFISKPPFGKWIDGVHSTKLDENWIS